MFAAGKMKSELLFEIVFLDGLIDERKRTALDHAADAFGLDSRVARKACPSSEPTNTSVMLHVGKPPSAIIGSLTRSEKRSNDNGPRVFAST